MSNISYYSKEGLSKMIEELHHLKTKGRSDMSKQIAEARDKGAGRIEDTPTVRPQRLNVRRGQRGALHLAQIAANRFHVIPPLHLEF